MGVHVVLPAHRRARRAHQLFGPRLARRPLARHQGVPGRRAHDFAQRRVLRRHCAEWMEAVKAKELAEAKAKKKSIPKQDDDKFDALGNKIETAVAAADIDRDYVKAYEAAQGPQGAR